MWPIRAAAGKTTVPLESVLASSTQNDRTGVAASVENVGRSHLNYQPGSPTAATPSTSAATPPTQPNPSKVPISEMEAKAFTDGMARAKMEDVMKKLGLDKEELSKLSADLKKALDEINNSKEIDIAQKSVINDYLRAFVLHVAFYLDSKENPKEDTELKQDIKGFVEKLSKMSNSSVKKVLDNCIWQGKGSLKKIMSKITEKIVAENTENITPPEGISFNEYRDSVATRLLLEYLLTNIIYPKRARIMKEAGYDEKMRAMIRSCVINQLKFKYILMDSWFYAKENFDFIVQKKKHFIAALKENRLVALSEEEKKQGRFVRMSSLELSDQQGVRGWLKGFEKEVLLVRRVFTNKDGSTSLLKVEEFHKSLQSNASLAKSPTRRVMTQNNHVFMSI